VLHGPRATASLLNSALGSKDVELAGTGLFAPAWVQKSEKIRMDLTVLKDRLNKLKEMHSKMLLVSFDSDNSAQAHVEALTRELQNSFKKLNNEINGMEHTPGSDDAEVGIGPMRAHCAGPSDCDRRTNMNVKIMIQS